MLTTVSWVWSCGIILNSKWSHSALFPAHVISVLHIKFFSWWFWNISIINTHYLMFLQISLTCWQKKKKIRKDGGIPDLDYTSRTLAYLWTFRLTANWNSLFMAQRYWLTYCTCQYVGRSHPAVGHIGCLSESTATCRRGNTPLTGYIIMHNNLPKKYPEQKACQSCCVSSHV